MGSVHEAFSKTARLLLGSELGGMDDYEGWLKRGVRWKREVESEVSGKKVAVPLLAFYNLAKRGFVTMEESLELGKKPSPVKDIESVCLKNASACFREILFFTPEMMLGENICVEDTCTSFSSQYSIRGIYPNSCKYTAYCYWPRNSQYVFGSSMLFSCEFCMKCSNSENLTRCFETSDSHSCSDCYFCHNCENMRDSMFCFNAKNMKYAIGNTELGRQEYMRIKELILGEIAARLKRDKTLQPSIFNVSCASKRKK